MKGAAAIMLGLTVLGGCDWPTAQERAENRRRGEARLAAREAQHRYDRAYDSCMYRVTGPFAGASFEVMKECERQACAIAPTPHSQCSRPREDK